MDPEQIPNEPRTDPERTLNGPRGRFDSGVGLRVPETGEQIGTGLAEGFGRGGVAVASQALVISWPPQEDLALAMATLHPWPRPRGPAYPS